MIGVVHATRPIDAIQRIIGRVELGMIPSIIDTTIYIDEGQVKAIYEVKLTVKVPSGMLEADLARPVIEIRDFETGELAHEIYTYGEQTIVMDIAAEKIEKPAVHRIAEKEIEREIMKKVPRANIQVEMKSDRRANVWVDEDHIAQLIGKRGKTIDEIESKVGLKITVESFESREIDEQGPVQVELSGNYVVLNFGKEAVGTPFDIMVDNDYLFTATVGKKGTIKIKKDIELAEIILNAMKLNQPIGVRIRQE
jgi:ATPase